MSPGPCSQEVLNDYWARLGSLSAKEWECFYRCVRTALLRCPAPELSSLPDSRENYIDEFFEEKIFFKAERLLAGATQSISGGALCSFFRNYLRDRLRERAQLLSDGFQWDAVADPAGDSDAGCEEFIARVGPDALDRSVKAFLAGLEDWAILMLRKHQCADEERAVPMVILCKGIPSYHYKATKLGITVKKNPGGFLGYEHTLIGKWMVSLGARIVPEDYSILLFLLNALCLQVAMREEQPSP